MFLFIVDGNRDLDDPQTAPMPACSADSFSGTATWGAAPLTLEVFLFRLVCSPYII
jgi:hypothetical protein